MTFIDWIKKVRRDARVGTFFQSESVFNCVFHTIETELVPTAGIFGDFKSMPQMIFKCRLCHKKSAACTCFEDYHAGKLPTERIEFFIKHKF